MNVFILSTGRCGSTAIARACKHIINYTSAHESRCELMGDARLAYPDNHTESDNRLSWYLGRLHTKYGDDAFYVHLSRNRQRVAESYAGRDNLSYGIMQAFRGIMITEKELDPLELAHEVCETVDSNIDFFLRDKPRVMRVCIEDAEAWFPEFWEWIGAEGDQAEALREFTVLHNATRDPALNSRPPLLTRIARKGQRIAPKFPEFLLEA